MADRRAGWDSTFKEFSTANTNKVVRQLEDYITSISTDNVSESQKTAWDNSVDRLQIEVKNIINQKEITERYDLILEYELPLDFRRPDNILLLKNSVVVIEFKGKPNATKADIDQTHAYARDLRLYHRECHERPVHPILVNVSKKDDGYKERGVDICGPKDLPKLILELDIKSSNEDHQKLDREDFLSEDSYSPLPTLVTAAREIFNSRKIRKLWQSIVNTDEATNEVEKIIQEAYKNKTKHLVLITGVPGAGKTLVGLRVVHNENLDQFKKDSDIPSVFLSGNGPLVNVLRFLLKSADADGRTFVRPVNTYIEKNIKPKAKLNEHIIVFDEAQRAWDKEYVTFKKGKEQSLTEPESLVTIADKSNDWSVIVGLIGTGQEIHIGEESGLRLWAEAIDQSKNDWIVHGSEHLANDFNQVVGFKQNEKLHLADSVRSHKSNILHKYVNNLLDFSLSTDKLNNLYKQINESGFDFYVTRKSKECREYLQDRYMENKLARYGKIASSRANGLEEYGFDNTYMAMKVFGKKLGPWFANGKDEEVSCCNLCDCVTEMEIQGLELDATWICWGKDLIKEENDWDISLSKKYKLKQLIKDPKQIRINAYRVLLTRARDACLVYIPEIIINKEDILRETYQYLKDCGMKEL